MKTQVHTEIVKPYRDTQHVRIDKPNHQRLKYESIRRQTTISELLSDIVDRYFDEQKIKHDFKL